MGFLYLYFMLLVENRVFGGDMKKRIFLVSLLIVAAVWCFGQTNFARGEELFMQNKPAEARSSLENAVAEDPANVKAFLYLGIVYEQLNMTDEAIAVYRRVLDRAGNFTANVANNLGNAYFKKDNITESEALYTRALEADRMYPSAYLGRANARIKRGLLREAVTDYEQYLLLYPHCPQRQAIVNLIALLKSEFAEAERQRILSEERARAEAEQRQRLLDEIANSLNAAAAASQGLSSGVENVEGYAGEFELE